MGKAGEKGNVPHVRYVIELDERHAAVLTQALELFARCGIGQYSYLMETPGMWELGADTLQAGRDMLDRLHVLILQQPPNAGPGMGSDRVRSEYKVAWDMYQGIRHRLSWDKNPKGGWTVNYDEPFHTDHSVPLIQIRKQDV